MHSQLRSLKPIRLYKGHLISARKGLWYNDEKYTWVGFFSATAHDAQRIREYPDGFKIYGNDLNINKFRAVVTTKRFFERFEWTGLDNMADVYEILSTPYLFIVYTVY